MKFTFKMVTDFIFNLDKSDPHRSLIQVIIYVRFIADAAFKIPNPFYLMYEWDGSQQKRKCDICKQRKLRSDCADAQSDQSLLCLHEHAMYREEPTGPLVRSMTRH